VSAGDAQKRAAAVAAVERHVRRGMALGLGTGTTARYMLEELAGRLRDGRLSGIVGVPTSNGTAAFARELGIPLASLAERPRLDLAIDGADEIDPELRLIKGGGGAHLHEKIVASAAATFLVIADEGKLVARLGERFPLPVEVVAFARTVCEGRLAALGWRPRLRERDGRPVLTDERNMLLDCTRDDWSDPATLARDVRAIPGVVEHGFFLGMASAALVGTAGGGVRELKPAV
jgi:ribose 5-phosphate isomerase A